MNGNVKKTIVGASCMACVLLAYAEEALVADGPWKMEQATKCGVCAAGRSDETAFWQARIDATAARGGGQVTVPAGRHLVAGLFLRDNIELHLEEGAVLEGLVGLEHYPVLSMPHSEGAWSAIVMATNTVNVAVSGKGEIFGNGTAWPQPENYGNNQEGLRARGLFFSGCCGVRLADVTLRDAACWGVVFKCCDGVEVRRLTIDSHANANNDGIDVEARNVVIADCDIDSGDDAVCLKSNDPDFILENILVTNVTARSNCACFKIGTASHGIVRNVSFVDCRAGAPRRDFPDRRPDTGKPAGVGWFYSDWRASILPPTEPDGLWSANALAVECVDGGLVEDVRFKDIAVRGTAVPIFVRGGVRQSRSTGTPPGKWYVLRNVVFENVSGESLSCVPSSVTGVEGCRVRDVTLRNVHFTLPGGGDTSAERARPVPELPGRTPGVTMFEQLLPAYGLWARHVDGLSLEDVVFCLKEGTFDRREAIVLDDVGTDRPWEMEQASAPGKWMPAVVPGTVLSTLVKNGIVPDPYYGLNNQYGNGPIPDVKDNRDFYTATYRTTVAIPAEWKGRKVFMRPEGINYRGEILLNGKTAAMTAGMFQRNVIDVTHLVKVGEANELIVKVSPLDIPGGPGHKPWGAPGEWKNGGDGFIGKNVTMLMTAGWDFMFNDGIRDRNTGIWKPIVFFPARDVRLDHPFVRTTLNADMTEAMLEMEVEVCNTAKFPHYNVEGDITAEVEGTPVKVTQEFELGTGERRFITLRGTLKNPRLWWPVNKGPRHFYNVKFTVNAAGYDAWWQNEKEGHVPPRTRAAELTSRFAVRECMSDQSGPDGARQFYVNRRKIFIRGTNWIPEAMLKADDARMERELRLTAESGVNMVRLWAGGIVESDRFYELCDEYGLLVWQEFFLTADTCQPEDRALYLDNVAQQVKRIRNHPSVVHWCGANESMAIEGTEKLIRELTGTESWMPQSECDGVHDGSPYFPVNPMRYYADTASPRGSRVYGFSPEYGTCALPCYEQILTFMPENLLWPMAGNEANWKYREGGGFDQMTKYHHSAVQAYGESKSLEEYARKSQAADAMGHRCLWEAWNLARNRATGVLFWYNNTPIPQLGSHAWDYDLNQEAAFFAQRNALEPLHAQFEYLSNRVFVVSDIVTDKRLTVRAEVYDFESRKVWEKDAKIEVEGEGCVEAFAIPFDTPDQSNNPNNLNNRTIQHLPHFIKLRLFESGEEIATTFYWRSNSVYSEEKREEAVGPCVGGFEELVNLPRTTLRVERTAKGVRVTNTGDRLAFFVRIKAMKDGKLVVPVHYSDNYLNLLPGESSDVEVEDLPQNAEFNVAAWNADCVKGD